MAGHRIPVKNYFKFNKTRKKIIKIHDILRVTCQKLGGLPIKNRQILPPF